MSRMGAHQSSNASGVDWLTPPAWIKKLGPFDMDPACAFNMPWRTATTMLTRDDNGLAKEWSGRVWLNPPYGRKKHLEPWMARMAHHNNGIALLFARTDTECWHKYIFPIASGALFVMGRVNFFRPDGVQSQRNCGAPVALLAYGPANLEALARCAIPGKLVVFNAAQERFL